MREIGLVIYPGFQVLSLAVSTVFEFANQGVDKPAYTIHLLSENGGRVPTSLGFCVDSEQFDSRAYDTVLVLGDNFAAVPTAGLLDYVRQASVTSRRIGAACTAAFILAEAGVLDGRRVTTHWYYANVLRRGYPRVNVDEDRIFIIDGNVWTSAGMTAGVDLALAMVEKDLGAEVARMVARKLVLYHRRSGGQSQHSALLELNAKSDRIQKALDHARQNLQADLSVEELAAAAQLSPRQFSRLFSAETGQSPAKAVERLRVEAARGMMEEGRHPIDVVARHTGFGDRDRMRRAFLRAFGQPPRTLQRNGPNGAAI